MELYIGGYAQGKLTYVRKKYPKAQIYDENNWQQLAAYTGQTVVCNHLHRIIAAELAAGKTQAEILAELQPVRQRYEKICFICDEIGNGIVPIEKAERDYREVTGRILTVLAEQAETVTRILCGLGQCIKGA